MAYAQFHGISLADGGTINGLHLEVVDVDPVVNRPGRLWYSRANGRLKFTALDNTGALVVLSFSSFQEMAQALALKLDKAEYTPQAVLEMVKQVDGPGSGLNADRLDGLQAGDFASYAMGQKANTALQPGDVGTAAIRDVPEAGNAAPDQVVVGNDTRLTDPRTPTAHTHAQADVDGLPDALAAKVDKVPGKGLSAEDYTAAEKSKLAGIDPGAQVNPEIIDTLTSTATDKPLSANQGRVLNGFIDAINTLLSSSDTALDELQEIVDYIKLNRETLETLGIGSIAGLQAALDGKQAASEVLTATTASFTVALLNKLNGIQDGATGAMTAGEIVAALLTVDGAGSGLDADTVDGLHATAFATAEQGGKADTAVQPGQLAQVATTGQYGDLLGKPALGTAAAKNAPAAGNAASGEVVLGDDTRLTDARAPTAHGHAISDVAGLETALTGKEPAIANSTTATYWRGDKTWRNFFADVRAATLTGLSTATNAVISATDTVLEALGKLQKQISDHTGSISNPHSTTAAQVGADPAGTASGLMASHTGATDPHTQYLRRDEAAGGAASLTTPRTISATGDASWSVTFDGSANVSAVLTLANSGVAAGTYNNAATQVRPFTVDAKGRITGIGTAVTITPAFSSITGKPTTLSGYGITDGLTLGSTAGAAAGTASAGIATTAARSDHVHPSQTSVSGNAGTATSLATSRTFTVGNTGKTFNGTANVSWSLAEIGAAAASHNHDAGNITTGTLSVARLPAATLTVNDTIDCGQL